MFCNNCGEEITSKDKFCKNCGQAILDNENLTSPDDKTSDNKSTLDQENLSKLTKTPQELEEEYFRQKYSKYLVKGYYPDAKNLNFTGKGLTYSIISLFWIILATIASVVYFVHGDCISILNLLWLVIAPSLLCYLSTKTLKHAGNEDIITIKRCLIINKIVIITSITLIVLNLVFSVLLG